jgi:hypothetical protein
LTKKIPKIKIMSKRQNELYPSYKPGHSFLNPVFNL